MTVFASTLPSAEPDGVPYAVGAFLPAAEGDVGNQSANQPQNDPISVMYSCAICAVVQLTVQGNPSGVSAYVVMQTDLGDNVWIDVAGIVTSTGGTFLLSGGVSGANAFQQTRPVGTAPTSNFSNQFTLGGRIRFVGKWSQGSSSSSSSSSSGAIASAVSCTIRYKMLGLR
jgi:hypothetical protein